jgi:hypothetical protein
MKRKMRRGIADQLAWLLSSGERGRRSLALATGLGEIVVRQELEQLRSLGLAEMDRRGTRLTPQGEQEFAAVIDQVKEVEELRLEELELDRFTVGALVRGAAVSGPTWQFRDLAVREGASGAILITFTSSGLQFSDSGELLSAQNPQDAALLRASFPEQREGDLLILVSATDRRRAGLGLWMIITALLDC